MSETLWAVVIGGSIGVVSGAVATIPTLIVNYYRWKKEKKLEHLRAECRRREEVCKTVMEELWKLGGLETLPKELVVSFGIFLPEDAIETITRLVDEYQKTDQEDRTELLWQIATTLRNSVTEVHKEIKELLS